MRHADEAAEFGGAAPLPAADAGRPAARPAGEGQTGAAGPRPRRPPPRRRHQRPRRLRAHRRGRARPGPSVPGALDGSHLSGFGARPGEGRPHRVGAGARPRRRPPRQRGRPRRRRASGPSPTSASSRTSATSPWSSADWRRAHPSSPHSSRRGRHAVCGERLYDRPVHGRPLPDASGATRTALHAATLGFDHPATGERIHLTSPLPRDMQELLRKLRAGAGRGRRRAIPRAALRATYTREIPERASPSHSGRLSAGAGRPRAGRRPPERHGRAATPRGPGPARRRRPGCRRPAARRRAQGPRRREGRRRRPGRP